jgi:hypothetical protein
MDNNESYVYNNIIKKYSPKNLHWDFIEMFNSQGKSVAQAKKYPNSTFWSSYPDFECYDNEKLVMLMEIKGYNEYFDKREFKVGMRYRHYKSYLNVAREENANVRICFILHFSNKENIFWEELGNIFSFPRVVDDVEFYHRDYETGALIKTIEKAIIWDMAYFRTDEENLPIP